MTGGKGTGREKVMTDLSAIHLAGTEQPLVNLQQLVQSMCGESSMLVEVKSRQRTVGRLCRAVLDAIQGREAQIAVTSCNPEVSPWFAEHTPAGLPGLGVSEDGEVGFWGRLAGWLKTHGQLVRPP